MRSLTHRTLFLAVLCISLLLLSVIASPLQTPRRDSIAEPYSQSLKRSPTNPSNDLTSISPPKDHSLAIRLPSTDFHHPHIKPQHFNRHLAIQNQLPNLHPPLTERNLPLQLSIYGFTLLWQHMDIAFAAWTEHHRATKFYQDVIAQLPGGEWRRGPTVQNIAITYGVFKLFLTVNGVGAELPLGFVEAFARFMVQLSETVVFVGFQLVAFAAEVVVRITLALVEGDQQNIVRRGARGVGS